MREKVQKALKPTVRVPNRWSPSTDYAVRSPMARWHHVYDQAEVVLGEPQQFGKRTADFDYWLDDSFPPLGVLEIQRGHLLGRHGWVVSEDEFLLPDHSWAGRHVEDFTSALCFPSRSALMRNLDPWVAVTQLPGTCLSLTSDWSSVNYGHFLLDGIARFHLFIEAGFTLSDVDYVFVPVPNKGWKRFIDQLGVSDDQIIEPEERRAFQPETLIAPSFPGTRCNYPRFVVDFLRQTFLPERSKNNTASPFRRLYIPRNTTRRITNEDALIDLLRDHGFEVFNPADHDTPPAVFAEAEIVVGGHGAGLTDIAFCSPGAKVLELIPSDHVRPYWYTLSEAAGLEYSYLVGPSTEERPRSNVWPRPSPYDFTIDEEEFEAALKNLLKS